MLKFKLLPQNAHAITIKKSTALRMGKNALRFTMETGARKNYCLLRATAILHRAKTKLLALERDIQS